MKYELNALRLLSSHVTVLYVRAFAVRDCSGLAPKMDQAVSDFIASNVIYRGWRIQGVYRQWQLHMMRAFALFLPCQVYHEI